MKLQKKRGRILIIDIKKDLHVIKGLASDIRIKILDLLRKESLNVNEIAGILNIAQSTIATNIMILEKAGLIKAENTKAVKGSQKICHNVYDEFIIEFPSVNQNTEDDIIEVEMPLGLFIEYDVSAPCGMCSAEKIIGYLDTPESFLEPERVKAGLLWFEKGFVKYQFPNNALAKNKTIKKLEISAELSSETPGTNPRWPSDITLWINGIEAGTWTSPGDFGDKRGNYTPDWWKLEGSQYGLLKTWIVTEKEGTFVDGMKISPLKLEELNLEEHHSIKVMFGIKMDAENSGGINIFGRGFGNYNQDIILRLFF